MSPSWKLVLGLYPLTAGAMALSIYFASLILGWAGWPIITPMRSLWIGMPLGWPAACIYARHLTRLMAQVDGQA